MIEGVKPGEVVVVEGMLTLFEGAEVKDISGNVAPKVKDDTEKSKGNLPPKDAKQEKK